MRRALCTGVVLALALAAPASAARVDLMVAGKAGLLRPAGPVTLKRETAKVGRKRCRVAAATPLAALLRTSLTVRLKDYGSCGRRPADAALLYVRGIGAQREHGRDGWVFKIGRKVPSTGAGDPASRLRAGARLTWFWCHSGTSGCQRTLEATPEASSATAGAPLRVTVRGYDDRGRGKPVAGATVTLGTASAVSGPDGVATLTVPAGAARLKAVATKAGLVPSFAAEVSVS